MRVFRKGWRSVISCPHFVFAQTLVRMMGRIFAKEPSRLIGRGCFGWSRWCSRSRFKRDDHRSWAGCDRRRAGRYWCLRRGNAGRNRCIGNGRSWRDRVGGRRSGCPSFSGCNCNARCQGHSRCLGRGCQGVKGVWEGSRVEVAVGVSVAVEVGVGVRVGRLAIRRA